MTTDTIINTAVPVAVFVMMFALGLGLTLDDFRAALRTPKALVIGICAQIALVPVAGFLFATALQPDAAIGLGIVILALCPGGAMSNLMTRIAGGDVALSVSLTAVTNLLSVVTMPTLAFLAADHFLGAEVGRIAIGEITRRVLIVATVPVLLGTALRHIASGIVERWEAAVFRICLAIFVLIVGWAFAESAEVLRGGMLLLGWQLAALTLLLLGLGLALGHLFGLSPPQRTSIAVETGVQNSGLGLAAAAMLSADPSIFPLYGTPSVVYGAFTYALAFPLVVLSSRAWRRV